MRQGSGQAAVSRFAELPTMQRSVVILKDVLDEQLSEIATLLDLTVDAVKAHLAPAARGCGRSTRRRDRFRPRTGVCGGGALCRAVQPARLGRAASAAASDVKAQAVPRIRSAAQRRRRHVLRYLLEARSGVARARLARGSGSDCRVREQRGRHSRTISCGSNGATARSASIRD